MPRRRLIVLALLLAIGPACVRTRVGDIPGLSGEGPGSGAAFTVNGRTYAISACWSGDREYFLGVDLVAEREGAVLRLLIDPLDGAHLRLSGAPKGSRGRALFDAATCRELHATVERTGWRVNHVRDLEGELRAACTSESGVELTARLSFAHCH